jgi:hypothetical protein
VDGSSGRRRPIKNIRIFHLSDTFYTKRSDRFSGISGNTNVSIHSNISLIAPYKRQRDRLVEHASMITARAANPSYFMETPQDKIHNPGMSELKDMSFNGQTVGPKDIANFKKITEKGNQSLTNALAKEQQVLFLSLFFDFSFFSFLFGTKNRMLQTSTYAF